MSGMCTVAPGLLMLTMMGATGAAWSQNYPTKPIRIIATQPGNFLDLTARILAQEIAGPLGQPVIVENRPTHVYLDVLLKAAPDGYTMSFSAGDVWITPFVQKTSYDVVRDFAPITTVLSNPYLLVLNPSEPAKSVRELIDLAKNKPGVINIAVSPVPGSASFLGAELFKAMAGINITSVPYNGAPAGANAVIGGEVQMMFLAVGAAVPHVKAGKLKALAVTSAAPSPVAPGVPTVASALPGYELTLLAGMLAPAGTPGPIVNRLSQELVRALNRPDIKEKLLSQGAVALGSTPAQFAALINADMVKWGKLLKDLGIKPDK